MEEGTELLVREPEEETGAVKYSIDLAEDAVAADQLVHYLGVVEAPEELVEQARVQAAKLHAEVERRVAAGESTLVEV